MSQFKNVLFLKTETAVLKVTDSSDTSKIQIQEHTGILEVPEGYQEIKSLFELSKEAFDAVDNYLTENKLSVTQILPVINKVTLELRETRKENNFKKK